MKHIKLFMIVVCLLASCVAPVIQTPTQILIPTTTSTQTLVSAPTNEIPTKSDFTSILNCQPIIESPITGNGYLIAGNLSANVYQLIDVSTFKASKLFEIYTQIAISPKSNTLAYIKSDDHAHLVLVTKQGQSSYAIDEEFSWLPQWASNTTLILKKDPATISSLLLLNPFSGDERIFDPNASLQNIFNLAPYETWHGSTLVVFDPLLEYVVYPRILKNGSADLALVEVNKNKVIASLSPMTIESSPEWSPNGNEFVVVEPSRINENGFPAQFEIFKVSKTGEVEVITKLSKDYPNVFANSYKWSPDGQFLAFWLNISPVNDSIASYLGILNVETNQLIITCLSSKISIYDYNPPIWSTDSTQLAININSEVDNKVDLAIVDIQKYEFTILKQGNVLTPLGWLDFKP